MFDFLRTGQIGFVHLFYLNLILSIVIIFFQRRDPRTVWTWILVLNFLPIIGIVLYLLIGQDYRKSKMFKMKTLDDRIRKAAIKQEDFFTSNENIMNDSYAKEYQRLMQYNLSSGGSLMTMKNSMDIFKDGNDKFDALINDIKNAKEILKRMNPNQKINYHTILTKLISDWENKDIRPKILIHSCCAPCSTYTLEFLTQYADVTVLFANNNIHPKAEYVKRALVQEEFIKKFNERTRNNVGFIEDEYKPMDFYKAVKGLENEKEGGARCTACFQMRLDIVAKKAQELGFDYFGSALTLSPHKNSQLINTLGLEIQEIFDVKYLPSDFKKNNGYKRSVDMCAEYDVYRQCYCGCVFAAMDQGIDLNEYK